MVRPLKYDRDPLCERRAHLPPRRGPSRGLRLVSPLLTLSLSVAGLLGSGCKTTSLAEIRGKSGAGTEFQHDGLKGTDQMRHYAVQGVEFKWDNGWTTGLTYRLRDVQDGNCNIENLVLFEVGYPIWKAPKKPEKTTERMDKLERELAELRAQLATVSERPDTATLAAAARQP